MNCEGYNSILQLFINLKGINKNIPDNLQGSPSLEASCKH
jgi:hypothetical protein